MANRYCNIHFQYGKWILQQQYDIGFFFSRSTADLENTAAIAPVVTTILVGLVINVLRIPFNEHHCYTFSYIRQVLSSQNNKSLMLLIYQSVTIYVYIYTESDCLSLHHVSHDLGHRFSCSWHSPLSPKVSFLVCSPQCSINVQEMQLPA